MLYVTKFTMCVLGDEACVKYMNIIAKICHSSKMTIQSKSVFYQVYIYQVSVLTKFWTKTFSRLLMLIPWYCVKSNSVLHGNKGIKHLIHFRENAIYVRF